MTAPNHVIGGFTFTGLFGSLIFGINILGNPLYLVIAFFASLLPDIDHSKSSLGRLIKPISRRINRHYGHRTLTHSFVFWAVLTIVFVFLNKLFLGNSEFATIFSLAYLSHLIFDMFTLMGVQFGYPFTRRPFWMFDNPEYRLRTGSVRGEAMWMFVFIGMFFMMQGLFEKGFWTTYNQSLSRHGHLFSEFQRSDDVLELKYTYKVGNEILRDSGLCVEVNMGQVVIFRNEEFKILTADKLKTARFEFEHTETQMFFKEFDFYQISPDSLNSIIRDFPILNIQVFANQSFEYIENTFPETAKKFSKTYLPEIRFSSAETTDRPEAFDYRPNPRILTLLKKLEIEKSIFVRVLADFEAKKKTLHFLRNSIKNEADFVKRQRLQEKYLELERTVKTPPTSERIDDLKNEIRELKATEIADNNLRKLEIEERNYLKRKPKTILTGTLTLLTFKTKNDENFTTDFDADLCNLPN